MKKIFLTSLLTLCLYANEEAPQTTQLEMFLFKIGFQSLLNDYNNSKTDISNNTDTIQRVENKVDYILEKLNTLNNNSLETSPNIQNNNLPVLTTDDNNYSQKISNLENKIKELENTIKSYKNNAQKVVYKAPTPKTTPSSNTNLGGEYFINTDESYIRFSPFAREDNIVRKTFRNEIIHLESCDKFGWCKIKDEDKYIARYILKRVE